ncbi:EAL domain-containing protein [Natronosporangium hydrolyticum]|uniref:EAL domain-containing protein n=1 Tax=Natronosporangium hydrolyticum TaxID=2811111 RepID=A0A895YE12_9ACTN|nr:GGDEF domain-containing phosphodiesterase [Natronosporangium hydrolyticum]QSB13639.1 EAL domain-containing protein [Natronosporangium hydrolyticum]
MPRGGSGLPDLPPLLPAMISIGALAALAGSQFGGFDAIAAAALAVAVSALLPALALVRRGWAIRTSGRVSARVARGACRCPGLLGVGVVSTGGTVAALPWVPADLRPMLAAGGLVVAAGAFIVGLLQIPGAAFTLAGRLRHGFDGLIVGMCLALVGWLLIPGFGAEYPLGYLAASLAAAGAAVAATVVLGPVRRRIAVVPCAGGAVLAIAGLALLVVTLGKSGPSWLTLAAAGLAVGGPPLIWFGARLVAPASEPVPMGRVAPAFGGYPVLAIPVAAATLAIAHHLLTSAELDRAAMFLGALVGGLLALREFPNAADLRRYAHRLAAQETRLRALLAGANDVTMVLDNDFVVRWQSPAAERLFGLHREDLVGHRFLDLLHPDDRAIAADELRAVVGRTPAARPSLLVARLRDGLGCWRDTESTVSDLRANPVVGALVLQVRDVSQRVVLERTLQRLTCCDQLTGLSNRRELLRAISSRRGAGRRSGTLLVVDLTGFCAINDVVGRAAGDSLLLAAAQRLRSLVGAEDLASRLGERQFAVVTASGPIEAYALGCRLLAELSRAYPLPAGRPVRLVVSVGLTALEETASAEEVVRRGDLAVRRAAESGATRIDWYDESLEELLVRRLDVERHLPGAAGRGELDLLYQPVVELGSGRPVGVEALLRWRHPVLGTVLPAELLPAAERLRVAGEISEWALHTACRQVAAWRRRGHDLWLAMNVSARQLASSEFVPEVAAALSVHQSPPERLTIEVSEVELADQVSSVAGQLSRLRALGVRTGLDDVGTCDTDLARLRRLPIDVVKLCPPGAIAGDGAALEVAAAVVEVARRLGAVVVAEGLETDDERRLAHDAGCEFGQGFVVAAFSPAEHLEAFLERHRPAPR